MQKTIPTIFLVFAVLFATAGTSWGQAVQWEDLVYREGLHYQKFSDVPFTGVTTGLVQATIKNGILHGPWISYYSNGQLYQKGNFKNGNWHGPRVSYHMNGQLASKGSYIYGLREGPWVVYYENGQLWSKGNYTNFVRDGPWVRYSEDGQLWSKGTYKDGVKVSD